MLFVLIGNDENVAYVSPTHVSRRYGGNGLTEIEKTDPGIPSAHLSGGGADRDSWVCRLFQMSGMRLQSFWREY